MNWQMAQMKNGPGLQWESFNEMTLALLLNENIRWFW